MANLHKINLENLHLHQKIMKLIEDTCFRIEVSGVPVEISREVEAKATEMIKRQLEGKTPDEIADMLAYSVYMNIAVALENTDSEGVGVTV